MCVDSMLREMHDVLNYSLWLTPVTNDIKDNADSNNLRKNGNRFDADVVFNATIKRCKNIVGPGRHFPNTIMGQDHSKHGIGLIPLFDKGYGWEKVFKTHCIMSTFIYIRELLGRSHRLSAYKLSQIRQFSKKEGDKSYAFGMDYSLKEGIISLNKATINDGENRIKIIGADSCSNYNAAIKKKIETIEYYFSTYTNIDFKNSVLIPDSENNNFGFPLSSIDIINMIASKPNTMYLRTLSSVLKGYRARLSDGTSISWNYSKFSEAKKYYTDYIKNNQYLKNSDKLYLHYQLESLFNFSIADSIYAIKKNIETNGYNLPEATLTTIFSAIRLPNISTRKYCLQYFFDCLEDAERDFSDNLFDTFTDPSVIGIIDNSTNSMADFTRINMWSSLFEKAICYLADFAMPIYESVFLDQLLIMYGYPFAEEPVMGYLEKIYDDLVDYFSNQNNYEEIVNFDDTLYKTANKIYSFNEKYPKSSFFVATEQELTRKSEKDEYKRILYAINNYWKAATPFTPLTKEYLKSKSSFVEKRVIETIFQGIISK